MMQRAADGTNEDTHTLSDVKGSVYKKFQVKPSVKGFISGMSLLPKIMGKNGKYYSYFDIRMASKDNKGGIKAQLQLPADFLIDENGIIVDVHRSKKTQDYIGFERIEAFIPKEKRCSCNKKDCISPACRETYAQIRKDAEAMLYLG
mmetsp:Transcript_21075/g.42163  ORF Transcript_21075/g.42163 Transcript_21075/m.42163 type:complete len:147 (+) Transcript_21075:390-830(+)|eukprot:scaffold8422_cov153-Skeletonema_marinoi.AAC.1